MAITINGNGSLTGVSVGGLPDGIVDTDMLADDAVTSAKAIGRGITNLSVWYVTTSFTGGANPVVNWAEYSAHGNTTGFGSSMTQSNGIWTFPSTGFWQVNCQAYAYGSTGHDSYSIYTQISTDSGSSYAGAPLRSYSNIPAISGTWYSQNQNTMYYDVTNASTTRVKVRIDGNPDNINGGGTFVRFMRLGDT